MLSGFGETLAPETLHRDGCRLLAIRQRMRHTPRPANAGCFHYALFLVSKAMYSASLRTMDSENCFDFLRDPDGTVLFLS